MTEQESLIIELVLAAEAHGETALVARAQQTVRPAVSDQLQAERDSGGLERYRHAPVVAEQPVSEDGHG